jgi:hypothetical protein
MDSTSKYNIRQVTEEEISRLERALGKPIKQDYLAYWISTAIRDVLRMAEPLVSPTEYREELRQIAQRGRKWIETVAQCRSTPLLPKVLEVEQLTSSIATFSDAVASLADQAGKSIGPGRPETHLALAAFLDRLIGIAKRASVLPSIPGRALRSHTAPREPPPFYNFVTEALEIGMDVIKSSSLPPSDIDRALAILAPSEAVLTKLLEQLRGRIGNYHQGGVGLVERGWDSLENPDPNSA